MRNELRNCLKDMTQRSQTKLHLKDSSGLIPKILKFLKRTVAAHIS